MKKKELLDKINKLDAEILKLTNERKAFKKEFTAIVEAEDRDFAKNIPLIPADVTDKQWEWLLYHWHDETSAAYDIRTKYLQTVMKLYPGEIAGGSDHCDTVRQFCFTAFDRTDLDQFFKSWLSLTAHLNNFMSPVGDVEIVRFKCLISIYENNTFCNWYVEYSIDTGLFRLVDDTRRTKVEKDWCGFEEMLTYLKSKQNEEH